MKTFFSFSLLSISLLSSAAFRGGTGQSLIDDTCKTSSQNDPNVDFSFCTTSLQAAPASQCTAFRGLGMISIRLVRYNVTDTRCHIKQVLKNKKLDPYVRECLKDCFDLYSDAILSIKQATKYFKSKRFIDANIEISSIMDASTTCEDGFEEKTGVGVGVVSPLTKRNNDTFELSAMALSIVNMLQTGFHS